MSRKRQSSLLKTTDQQLKRLSETSLLGFPQSPGKPEAKPFGVPRHCSRAEPGMENRRPLRRPLLSASRAAQSPHRRGGPRARVPPAPATAGGVCRALRGVLLSAHAATNSALTYWSAAFKDSNSLAIFWTLKLRLVCTRTRSVRCLAQKLLWQSKK